MTASLSRRSCSPAAPPLEDDDLLSEILLRLPPQPSSLPRASAVCKRWRHLVSDPRFRRRFRLRHRSNPPLLGFFAGGDVLSFRPTLEAPDCVPPERFSLQGDDGDGFLRPLGCRHGLVLILLLKRLQILVWDPVTGNQHRVDVPPGFATGDLDEALINGAVLPAAGDVQHFQVVLVVADGDDVQHRRAVACVYSSEAGLWGSFISMPLPYQADGSSFPAIVCRDDAVLAGDSLYWVLAGSLFAGSLHGILEFDLEKQRLAVIQVPVDMCGKRNSFKLLRAEGSVVGFLFVSDLHCSTAQLWKRMTDCDGAASWVLAKTIELDKLLSLEPEVKGCKMVLGFAENNNMLLLWTVIGLFMIHLDSLKFKKLSGTMAMSHHHPFESVYTTETCAGGGHGGAELLCNM